MNAGVESVLNYKSTAKYTDYFAKITAERDAVVGMCSNNVLQILFSMNDHDYSLPLRYGLQWKEHMQEDDN